MACGTAESGLAGTARGRTMALSTSLLGQRPPRRDVLLQSGSGSDGFRGCKLKPCLNFKI